MPAEASERRLDPPAIVTTRSTCRLCASPQLEPVWNFGATPLANAYLNPDDLGQPELSAPLTVQRCRACELVQLKEVVAPDALFRHYLYVSSTSATFRAHFDQYAAELTDRFKLAQQSLAVDVGSNDGILLAPLQARGLRVLGIDPAENVAALANAAGLPTLPAYFTPETALQVAREHGPAAVITANNVFAHTDRLDIFVEAVKELLAPDGVFVFEVQYLGDLLTHNLFDIIYHEHLCYYHLRPLVPFFAARGLEVFDVQRVPVHGGSLRVFVSRKAPQNAGASRGHGTTQRTPSARLRQLLQEEEQAGLNTPEPYRAFAARLADNKQKLRSLLDQLKRAGQRIVGYGAPAKATTLSYVFGLDGRYLDYIVDDAPLKQGRLMPGTHVPITSPQKLYADRPDFCLILAWNFAEPIMQSHRRFTEQGGRFIIPVPEPRLV